MPEAEARTIQRRTLIGAAWAAPVIATAVAAPLAAASTATARLSATYVGPTEYTPSGATTYRVYFMNDGPYSIVSPDLTVFIPTSGQGWNWQGFGGPGWNYAPDGITSTSYTFRYEGTIEPGRNAGLFYFIAGSNDRTASPTPTAQLTAMAPGYDAYSVSLPIPY
jgi:hypothetical protein